MLNSWWLLSFCMRLSSEQRPEGKWKDPGVVYKASPGDDATARRQGSCQRAIEDSKAFATCYSIRSALAQTDWKLNGWVGEQTHLWTGPISIWRDVLVLAQFCVSLSTRAASLLPAIGWKGKAHHLLGNNNNRNNNNGSANSNLGCGTLRASFFFFQYIKAATDPFQTSVPF